MYTVYITPVDFWIMLAGAIFVILVLAWSVREGRKDDKEQAEINRLNACWDLTEDLDEDELDEEFSP